MFTIVTGMHTIVTCDNCFKEIAARWAEEGLDGMELSVRDVDLDGGPLGWMSCLKHSPPRPKGSELTVKRITLRRC